MLQTCFIALFRINQFPNYLTRCVTEWIHSYRPILGKNGYINAINMTGQALCLQVSCTKVHTVLMLVNLYDPSWTEHSSVCLCAHSKSFDPFHSPEEYHSDSKWKEMWTRPGVPSHLGSGEANFSWRTVWTLQRREGTWFTFPSLTGKDGVKTLQLITLPFLPSCPLTPSLQLDRQAPLLPESTENLCHFTNRCHCNAARGAFSTWDLRGDFIHHIM